MKPSPEDLEKMIQQTLRSLPNRRAPRSLETRVMAAIEARASLPWWKQSYAQWPLVVRCAFLVLSGVFAKIALMGTVWIMADFESAGWVNAFTTQFAWVDRVSSAFGGVGQFFTIVGRNIPPAWLYGGLAVFALLYATLFGLGATAYRTLYSNR
jgi:hypothetical protein